MRIFSVILYLWLSLLLSSCCCYPHNSVYASLDGENIGDYRIVASLDGRPIAFHTFYIWHYDSVITDFSYWEDSLESRLESYHYLRAEKLDSLRSLNMMPVDILSASQEDSKFITLNKKNREVKVWLTRYSGRDSLFLGKDTILYKPHFFKSFIEVDVHVGSSRPDKRELMFIGRKPKAHYWDAIRDSVYFCIYQDSL